VDAQVQLPSHSEVHNLLQKYFATVHCTSRPPRDFPLTRAKGSVYVLADTAPWQDYGFFTFIHQIRFNRLLDAGKAPKDLLLIMMANAMR
jgi:hypothetical protein